MITEIGACRVTQLCFVGAKGNVKGRFVLMFQRGGKPTFAIDYTTDLHVVRSAVPREAPYDADKAGRVRKYLRAGCRDFGLRINGRTSPSLQRQAPRPLSSAWSVSVLLPPSLPRTVLFQNCHTGQCYFRRPRLELLTSKQLERSCLRSILSKTCTEV